MIIRYQENNPTERCRNCWFVTGFFRGRNWPCHGGWFGRVLQSKYKIAASYTSRQYTIVLGMSDLHPKILIRAANALLFGVGREFE